MPELLESLVARARQYHMTPRERRQQRISLIMGLRAADSTLSREKVEEMIEMREGGDRED